MSGDNMSSPPAVNVKGQWDSRLACLELESPSTMPFYSAAPITTGCRRISGW